MPYQYLDLLKSRVVKRLIVGVWCFSALWTLLGVWNWDHENSYPNYHLHKHHINTTLHNITYIRQISQNVAKEPQVFSIHAHPVCTNTNTQYLIACFYGIYIPVLVLMTCAYIKILHVALRQIRKIKQHGEVREDKSLPYIKSKLLVNSNEDVTTLHPQRKPIRLNQNKGNLRRELQATKSVVIVYLAFCVCWLPTCIITTIAHMDELYFLKLRQENWIAFLIVYYIFIDILPLLNF